LILITDHRTKKYYDDLKITTLYDAVITDLLDDYPRDRISTNFWASPKIWAMSKLKAPFVIFDTDLVLHLPLINFADCDLLYLHRETSTVYPNIFDIATPPGFTWNQNLVWSFRNSQPMNCAVIGMFNDSFKSDYVRRYFEFVLDSTGEVSFASEGSRNSYPWSSAQIVAEQWLIAALADYWRNHLKAPIKSQALCKAIWTGEQFFPFDMDLGSEKISAELDSYFYHLWGAKVVQRNKNYADYKRVRDVLNTGRYIVERNPRFDAVKELFNELFEFDPATKLHC
jgi:hypothetical protein